MGYTANRSHSPRGHQAGFPAAAHCGCRVFLPFRQSRQFWSRAEAGPGLGPVAGSPDAAGIMRSPIRFSAMSTAYAYANAPRRALARRLQDQVGADTLAECLGVTPDALPDLLADAVPWPSAALAGLVRLAQRVDRASPAQPAPAAGRTVVAIATVSAIATVTATATAAQRRAAADLQSSPTAGPLSPRRPGPPVGPQRPIAL